MSDHTPEHRAEGEAEKPTILLNKSFYDLLKPVALIWLPALSVFYIAIAPLWDLPKQEEVAGSIMAFDLLLGAMLGISARQYQNSDERFDGAINVGQYDEEQGTTDVRVLVDPVALENKDEVTVKVNREE